MQLDTSDWSPEDWAHAYAAVVAARRNNNSKPLPKSQGPKPCCDRAAIGADCGCRSN